MTGARSRLHFLAQHAHPAIVSSSTKSSGGWPQCGQVRGDSHCPASSSSIGTPANRAAEELGLADLERPRSGDEAEDLHRWSHVEHLVESAKLAVRAAGHTSRQIEDRVRRRQRA